MKITEELYKKYRVELVNWCAAMTCSRAIAEDMVQEAFLRALINEEFIQGLLPEQKRAWLYRTVRNLYIDRIRKASFEAALCGLADEPQFLEAYDEVDVRQIMTLLPNDERILFAMRYLQGYNASELGKIFGLPAGTVRYKLSSARKRLRNELNPRDLTKGD